MKRTRLVLGCVVEHVEFVIWKSNLMRASRHTHVILDSFFLPPVVSPFIKAGKREFSNWPWHCIEPWLMPRHWTTLCAYYWDARDLWKWKTGPCVVEAVVFMWDRWRRVCQTIRCENINHAFWEKSVSLPVLRVYQIDRWKWRRSVRLIKLVSVMFY